MEANNKLVCVECGTERPVDDQTSSGQLTCDDCGFEGPAYIFDPYELLA